MAREGLDSTNSFNLNPPNLPAGMTYYAVVRAFVVIVTTRSCSTESPNLNGRALLHSGPTGTEAAAAGNRPRNLQR